MVRKLQTIAGFGIVIAAATLAMVAITMPSPHLVQFKVESVCSTTSWR